MNRLKRVQRLESKQNGSKHLRYLMAYIKAGRHAHHNPQDEEAQLEVQKARALYAESIQGRA